MRAHRMNMASWAFAAMAWAAMPGATFAQTGFQAGYGCLCVPLSMVETADGGFFLVGSNGVGTKVMKIDAGGAMEWSKLIDAEIDDFDPYFSLVLSNGDLLIAGGTAYWGASERKAILMRLTGENADVVWSTSFDPGFNTNIQKVVELPLGDLLIAGEILNNGLHHMYLAEVGADGTLGLVRRYYASGVLGLELWDDGRSAWTGTDRFSVIDSDGEMIVSDIQNSSSTCPRRIAALSDGSLLTLSTSYIGGQRRLSLTKLAADLTFQWTGQYTGPWFECGVDLRATPDGGCIITGTTEAVNGINQCGFLLKVDAFGEHEWSRAYCSTYEAISLQVCTDGGFALMGRCPTGLFAVRSDSLGYTSCGDSTLVWNTTLYTGSGSIGTVFNSVELAFEQTDVGPFVVTPLDVPVTEFCATGIDDGSLPTGDMVVWPNPVTTELWIRTESDRSDLWPLAIRVFDTRGACVLQRSLGAAQSARIDMGGLPVSLYLIEVTTRNGNRRFFRCVKSEE